MIFHPQQLKPDWDLKGQESRLKAEILKAFEFKPNRAAINLMNKRI
ncbi:MAG: hypothetical protein ACJA0U_002540 [Salibacteraceae bacterium]